jgi:hypothetical protein
MTAELMSMYRRREPNYFARDSGKFINQKKNSMKFFALISFFTFAFLSFDANACSPILREDPYPKNAKEVVEKILSGNPEFFGVVKIIEIKEESNYNKKIRMEVVKQYAGKPRKEISFLRPSTTCSMPKVDIGQPFLYKNHSPYFNFTDRSVYYYGIPEIEIQEYLDKAVKE